MTAKIDGTNGLIQQYDYQVLTTAFTYTFAAGTQVLVMNPAATLATGTITFPASPADGMTVTFSSTQQITALTLAGNGKTIVSAVTGMLANQATSYVYRLSNTSWYPLLSGVNSAPTFNANTNITTGQSLSAATWTLAQFSVENFDTASCYNNTGSTVGSIPAYAFLPNVAGYYLVYISVEINASLTSGVRIYKNGLSFKEGFVVNGGGQSATISSIMSLNGTTDYVQAYVYSNNATTAYIGPTSNEFSSCFLRGA